MIPFGLPVVPDDHKMHEQTSLGSLELKKSRDIAVLIMLHIYRNYRQMSLLQIKTIFRVKKC